jgi:signal peptidase II
MLRLSLILIAALVLVDQVSKYWVLEVLHFSPPGCREYGFGCRSIEVSPIFDLSMVWNRGVSFGLLRADNEFVRWALVALQLAIAGIFGWWLLRDLGNPFRMRGPLYRSPASGEGNLRTQLGLVFVVGGAIGNVIDRIRFGAVADFLDFRGLGFPWVFNVADAAINIGAGLLILDFLLRGDKRREAAPPPTAS